MPTILLDANVIIDIWHADPVWQSWSTSQVRAQSTSSDLGINAIVYSEISVSFPTPAALDNHLSELGITVLNIPLPAAFLAGKAYAEYRRRGGQRSNVLPDFFIGAHAQVLGCPLLTRDTRRYATYFPGVQLIAP
jgi:predicted nucleic acid-binding protein